MKAFLKNYRQSPRKVRLVASLVKGKDVGDAIVSLDMLTKRASLPLRKLLLSALANAKAQGMNESDLVIKDFFVDKGIVMKRMMPRAMGRGARINKRTSHVTVVLASRTANSGKKVKKEKKEVKVEKVEKKSKKVTAKKTKVK